MEGTGVAGLPWVWKGKRLVNRKHCMGSVNRAHRKESKGSRRGD